MPSSFRSLLAQRRFNYLVSSVTVGALGAWFVQRLLMEVIPRTSPGHVLAYSGGIIVIALPPVVLAPFVGVLVDRWDRRRALAVVHLLGGALMLTAPVVFWLARSLTPAWVILFLFYAVDVVKNSTAPTLLPRVIGPDEIVKANSLWFVFSRIATALGVVGGGLLVVRAGLERSFAIDALTHLGAGLLVLALPASPAFTPAAPAAGLRQELAAGLRRFVRQLGEVVRLVTRNRLVAFVMLSIVIAAMISSVAYTILLFLIREVLMLGSTGVNVYLGLLALGFLAGAALAGWLGDRVSRTGAIIAGCALIGILFLIGPWLVNVWYMAVIALVAGAAFSWIGIAQTIILQTRVPLEIQGRIFATREFFANATLLLTSLLIGGISLVASRNQLLLLIGAALLLFALLGWRLANRLGPA
jgi:MFS family permease